MSNPDPISSNNHATSMKIGFWNVTLGPTSFRDKRTVFSDWCASMNLDLLFLEEVGSDTTADTIENWSGMQSIGFANTLDINDNPTSKRLWALQRRNGVLFNCTLLRFPRLTQIRGLLKTTSSTTDVMIWSIHANASRSGGATAVAAVTAFLNASQAPNAAGKFTAVGGDFNSPFDAHVSGAVRALNWNGAPYLFTQWGKRDGTTQRGAVPELQLTNAHRAFSKIIEPHQVIDYIICGENVTADPVASIPDEPMWVNILVFFDHAPVVYNVGVRNNVPVQTRKRVAVQNLGDAIDSAADLVRAAAAVKRAATEAAQSLTTADSLLEAAEVIPDLRDKARKLRSNMIGPAKAEMDTMNKRLSPALDECVRMDPDAQKLSECWHTIRTQLDSTAKAPNRPRIEGVLGGAETIVIDIGDELPVFRNNVFSADALFGGMPDLVELKSAIDTISASLSSVDGALKPLIQSLNSINDLLHKDFGVSFSYPVPTKKFPFAEMHRANIAVKFATIIKGANAIEDEIEKRCGKVILDALKKIFGLDKCVKSLVAQAQNALSDVCKHLNLDITFDLKLPDIGDGLLAFVACLKLALTRIKIRVS